MLPNFKDGANLLIMGCPGSGKTTVGKVVAEMLGMTLVDFDQVLEKAWDMKVGDKLIQVGPDQFLKEEKDIFQSYTTTNSVISLSGSNPMDNQFKEHAHMLGAAFYLDVRQEDILKYLNKKTVDAANAVVGKHSGMSWQDVIEYRQQFYVKNYDIRILCEEGESPESVARKVVTEWKHLQNESMCYVSTRSCSPQDKKSFLQVIIQGLASDGGLYVPKQIPYFTLGQWKRLVTLPYQKRASTILEAWIPHTCIHPAQLQDMVVKAYENFQHKDIVPIRKLNEDMYFLELFYGPTASFKDLALQLMPQMFDKAVTKERLVGDSCDARYLVLVATSGDTGSAVLEGFKTCQNVSVIVFYPENGTSLIQKRQMTSMSGGNIKVVGVHGDFDFCQSTIKTIFNDNEYCEYLWQKYKYKLSAANSINWGRLLPQIVYHASGYLDLVKQGEVTMGDEVDLCVPTGNFGNILAAFYAKKMGIPFHNLICASNSNNVLHDFFTTGTYNLQNRNIILSISPSIDILKSSNLERFLYHITEDGNLVKNLFEQLNKDKYFQVSEKLHQSIAKHFTSGWASEQECQDSIKSCFNENNYLPDPHTAVGIHVAQQLKSNKVRKVLVAATAHYSKFPKDVLMALGKEASCETPEILLKQLEQLKTKPEMSSFVKEVIRKPEIHYDTCRKDLDDIKGLIENFLVNLDEKK